MRRHLSSITTFMVLVVFLSLFIPLFLGLKYTLRVEKEELKSELAGFHEDIISSMELGMKNAILNLEPNQAQTAARMVIRDSRILRIKVYSTVYGMDMANLTKPYAVPGTGAYTKRRYLTDGGKEIGYVEVAIDKAFYDRTLSHERMEIFILFGGMFLCGMIIIIPLLGFKVLRPVARLMRQAETISSGDMDTVFSWKGNDELSRLGTMIDTMRIRLGASFERIRELAVTDELTGMPNRRAFYKDAGKALDLSQRYDRPLCMILMDIDDFKRVNDTYGHATGDRVLKELAQVLMASTRKTDICARFGGEEFVVCMPETTYGQAREVAEKLRAKIESHFSTGGIPITASFGLAVSESQSLEGLIDQADRAMYQAKKRGRNRVCSYSSRDDSIICVK